MKWLRKAIRRERDALERARRRFICKPTEKRLHDVRTTGRRFRSLLEDVSELAPARKLLARVKRAAAATDAARDAAIALRLLDASIDEGERQNAAWLFAQLRQREAEATQRAHHRLRHARFVR
ncbi:MAG TPA: CHAD domain-containing protein [Candidatus Cybelea sp.]|jgi:hypothetical protein|nr:CHAD domain-containing protein [Candidatus Cybelea sp.]